MIYVPTLEELKIFVPDDIQSRENTHGMKWCELTGAGDTEVQEENGSLTMEPMVMGDYYEGENKISNVLYAMYLLSMEDIGFVGEGPNEYALGENEKIRVKHSGHNFWSIESESSDIGLKKHLRVPKDQKNIGFGNAYSKLCEFALKAYMFRLVLCWMRQQEDKRIAALKEKEVS